MESQAKIKTWLNEHKKQVLLVTTALVLAGMCGIGFFLHRQQERQSIGYALASLNTAIALRDLEKINDLVDFKELSRDFVRNLEEHLLQERLTEQVDSKDTDAHIVRRQREDAMQEVLLKAFAEDSKPDKTAESEKESAPKPATEGDAKDPPYKAQVERLKLEQEEKALRVAQIETDFRGSRLMSDLQEITRLGKVFTSLTTPPLLPAGFMDQLVAAPFTLLSSESEAAVFATRVQHPRLNLDLPLKLLVRKVAGAWLVVSVANVGELIRGYRQALNDFYDYREAVFHARNAATREVMYNHCVITECTTRITSQPQEQALRVVLTVAGTNTAQNEVHNASFVCVIKDEKGHEVKRALLQLGRAVSPGESFRQYWNFDIEEDSPAYVAFKRARTLKCQPELLAVNLVKGPLLFPRSFEELTGKRP